MRAGSMNYLASERHNGGLVRSSWFRIKSGDGWGAIEACIRRRRFFLRWDGWMDGWTREYAKFIAASSLSLTREPSPYSLYYRMRSLSLHWVQ